MPSGRDVQRLAWLGQPGYIAAEVLIGAALGVGYSFRDDTISALGTGCSSLVQQGCSSAPWVMNAVFIGFGALQAVGAWHLLRDRASRDHQVVGGLWAVSGSFSVLVGVFPVDSHPVAHTLVALPVFVCQPLALILHTRLLPPSKLRSAGMALGVVSVVGAAAFGLLLNSETWGGLTERAAIWPAKLWLALAALATTQPRY
ncbi:hypothetical protein BH23ACT6_BH23ACT6_07810 [soil metagenome]